MRCMMVSGVALSQTVKPRFVSFFWFSGAMTMPPPVEMIDFDGFWAISWSSRLVSFCLNPASPTSLKISGMVLFSVFSIS